MMALVLQEVTKDAITPSLVYLSALFSAEAIPFCLSHSRAFSWLHSDSSRAFLHSPIGALVSSLSFFIASRGTLREEKSFLAQLRTSMSINLIQARMEAKVKIYINVNISEIEILLFFTFYFFLRSTQLLHIFLFKKTNLFLELVFFNKKNHLGDLFRVQAFSNLVKGIVKNLSFLFDFFSKFYKILCWLLEMVTMIGYLLSNLMKISLIILIFNHFFCDFLYFFAPFFLFIRVYLPKKMFFMNCRP